MVPDACDTSKKFCELLHRKPGLSNQRPQGSLGEFLVIGNRQASVRWVGVPENHVAAVLLIEFVANFSERPDRFAARNTGNFISRRPQ